MANNGPDALIAAREQRPELMLLDIGLPGMDGYEVALALRQEVCCKDRLSSQFPDTDKTRTDGVARSQALTII